MEDATTAFMIAAATLPFTHPTSPEIVQTASPDLWHADLQTLASLGFSAVDITDCWLRPGDLSPDRLEDLRLAAESAGLAVPAVSVIRRSVIDPVDGDENLAYSHRSIEAAAALGCDVLSVGLHRPLSDAQKQVLWFWTVDGPTDPTDDETYALAANRLRELGAHADDVGVKLSLEMYEGTLLGTATSSLRLLDEIEHDNVGLNPDLGNLVRQQTSIESIESMLQLCLPVTNYWHVKNYLRMEDGLSDKVMTAPASMEMGVINYRHAVELAIELGFRGVFCIEHYGGDMLSVMETNRVYLANLLRNCNAVEEV